MTSFWLNFSIHFPWFLLVLLVSGSFKDNRCCKTLQSVWFALWGVLYCNEQQPLLLCWVCFCCLFLATGTLYLAMLFLLRWSCSCSIASVVMETAVVLKWVKVCVCGCLCVRRRASKRNVDKVLLYASRLFNTSSCIFIWMNKLLTALSIITNLENGCFIWIIGALSNSHPHPQWISLCAKENIDL